MFLGQDVLRLFQDVLSPDKMFFIDLEMFCKMFSRCFGSFEEDVSVEMFLKRRCFCGPKDVFAAGDVSGNFFC